MINIQNLSYTYPSGVPALLNISTQINQGESVGIIGANGAGKSTLICHLNGVLSPTSGEIIIDNLAVEKNNLESIRKKVGVVFQDPDDMLFMPRIIDDVLFGLENLGIEKEKALLDAERILEYLELWELKERPPFTLSQGQKRFAAIAAVMVMGPSILIFDEPTSDLDPGNRRKLISLLNKQLVTKIIVSHDLDFIWDTCERVILLSNGSIKANGPAIEILSSQALLEENGLELPLRLQK